jgi:hypothetical protein
MTALMPLVASSRVMYVWVNTVVRAGQVTMVVDMGHKKASPLMEVACSGQCPLLMVFLTANRKSLWDCMYV